MRVLTICSALCAVYFAASPYAQAERLIVSYKHPQAHYSTHSLIKGIQQVKQLGLANSKQIVVLQVSRTDESTLFNALKKDPNVRSVERDQRVKISDVAAPVEMQGLWGLQKIGLPDSWSSGTGTGVVVGVIDTGVQWDHPDLANQIWNNSGETDCNDGVDNDHNGYIDDCRGWDFYSNDNNPMDENGHGTHVSGTIAAEGNNGQGVVGIAPGAKIMPLRFLGPDGFGVISNAVLALDYAINNGANITNNSWGGGGYSQAMSDMIDKAKAKNVLFVAAAGNNAANNDRAGDGFYPSSYPQDNVIAVAATTPLDERSWFSNYGKTQVDIAAPGSQIYSTFLGSSYATLQGTSMAAPHASGALALLWGTMSNPSYIDVRNALFNGGVALPALKDITVTGKRIDINGSLDYLKVPYSGPSSITSPYLGFNLGVMTCNQGKWSAPPALGRYIWKHSGSIVAGEASSTYSPPASWYDDAFSCTTIAYDVQGHNLKIQSQALVPSSLPLVINTPSITGGIGMDRILTCNIGTWKGAIARYEFQWYRSGAAVDGAIASTYKTASADRGLPLYCEFQGSNSVTGIKVKSKAFTANWKDDTVAPAGVAVIGTPAAYLNKNTLALTFKGEPGAQFNCAYDSSEYQPCPSAYSIPRMAEGPHSLSVTQEDTAGNIGPSTKINWSVDTIIPDALRIGFNLDSSKDAPTDDGIPMPGRSKSIAIFLSGEASPALFYCSLDNAKFSVCGKKNIYSNLKDGVHSFKSYQVDAAKNQSPTASISWSLDNTPPSIPVLTDKPPAILGRKTASFAWSQDYTATSECSVDGSAFSYCTQPYTTTELSDGSHVFVVRKIDLAGNISMSVPYNWQVDTTTPNAPTIIGAPAVLSNSSSSRFEWSGEPGATFQCSVDAWAPVPCLSVKILGALADGPHTMYVQQIDLAMNYSSVKSYTWTVDRTPPSAPILSGTPTSGSSEKMPSFNISATEQAGITFKCAMDNAAYAAAQACASVYTQSVPLKAGSHSFYAWQIDLAGNAGAPVKYTWTVGA